MNAVKVKAARKSFTSNRETKIVLDNFFMNIQRGSIYALMGSSGCGKTTLISCIIGTHSLDSGYIEVFGSSLVDKSRIGFMPQETALISSFTVREIFWFFGTILGLRKEKIEERFQFLSSLLKLPDRLIADCSGGQQRRISFALSLVHEPDLLILDEPTVGIDPLLRSTIWDHLMELAEKNVTILMTTHYIEEARQSTCIGIMRNGVQMIEDSPENVLSLYESKSLDEAFLKLSFMQENYSLSPNTSSGYYKMNFDEIPMEYSSKHQTSLNSKENNKRKVLKALLMKNLINIMRHIEIFVTILLLPLLGCLCLHFAIGDSIYGLTLGVVNHEVDSVEECFDPSLQTAVNDGYDCLISKISCRFIKQLQDEDMFVLKSLPIFEEAVIASKEGKIIGFIYFSSNFSQSFPIFNDDKTDISTSGQVQIYLDQTNFQINSFLKQNFYDFYQKFIENLMVDCGKSKKAGSLPITFEAAYGTLGFKMKLAIVSGITLGASFTASSFLTSASIISERTDGTWDRIITAGVDPKHFLTSHLVVGFITSLIQFIEWTGYFLIFLSPQITLNSMLVAMLLLFMNGLAGLCFGLLLSVVTHSVTTSLLVSQIFIYPANFISGFTWPIEGLPTILRCIGYFLPFSYTVHGLRNAIVKDATLFDFYVFMAVFVQTMWIVVSLLVTYWSLERQERRKNKNN